jgi:hypothetical protein
MIRIINEKGFPDLRYIVCRNSPRISEVLEDYSFIFDLGETSISEEFFSYNAEAKIVTARQGYQWDEATGLPKNKKLVRPSLLHDVTIQIIETLEAYPHYVDQAHQLFKEDCRNCGIPWFLTSIFYWGLVVLYPIHRKRRSTK